MDWATLVLSPATVAAAVALITTLVTQSANTARMKREFMLESRAESVALALLRHKKWGLRSFAKLKSRLGGFEDDELRRVLVRAGAVRFYKDGVEYWGLLDRNLKILDNQERLPRNPGASASDAVPPPPPPNASEAS